MATKQSTACARFPEHHGSCSSTDRSPFKIKSQFVSRVFAAFLYLKRVFVRAGDDPASVLDDLHTPDAAQLDGASPELLLWMEATCGPEFN